MEAGEVLAGERREVKGLIWLRGLVGKDDDWTMFMSYAIKLHSCLSS